MVGPWQVPVADVAVTLADYVGMAGEAMSMGERTPLAVLDLGHTLEKRNCGSRGVADNR